MILDVNCDQLLNRINLLTSVMVKCGVLLEVQAELFNTFVPAFISKCSSSHSYAGNSIRFQNFY
jgi:hypothetical protein